MGKSFTYTEDLKTELMAAKKANKNKNVDKRLTALLMRAEGKRRKEIAERTGLNDSYISNISAKYLSEGLDGITGNHYHANRRYLRITEKGL